MRTGIYEECYFSRHFTSNIMLHDMNFITGLSGKTAFDEHSLSHHFLKTIQNISAQALQHTHTGIGRISLCSDCREGAAPNRATVIPRHGDPIEYTHITAETLVTAIIFSSYSLIMVTVRSLSFVRLCYYMYLLLQVIYVMTCSSYPMRQKRS